MYIFLEKTASEQTCALLKFSAVENATKNHGSFMKNKINIIWAFASDQKEFSPLVCSSNPVSFKNNNVHQPCVIKSIYREKIKLT